MAAPGMAMGSRECDEQVEVWEVAREVGGRRASNEGLVGMRTDCDGRWISMMNVCAWMSLLEPEYHGSSRGNA